MLFKNKVQPWCAVWGNSLKKFFPLWNGFFFLYSVFSTCKVLSIKYKNFNLLEHERIRTGIRTLEVQIDEKNKNIEARQYITGSYKKKSL